MTVEPFTRGSDFGYDSFGVGEKLLARISPNATGVTVFDRLFECRSCGSFDGYASRPRTFAERYVLPLLFLRPVRCGRCFSRSLRSRWVSVHRQQPKSGSVASL